MAHYRNDYSKEEDAVLWQLHEIRHPLAEQRQSPEQINTTGLQLIRKYKLDNLKTVASDKMERGKRNEMHLLPRGYGKKGEHSQILVGALCLQCRPETLTPSAVPTGLAIPDTVPTDESVGYFHLSLRDKMPVYKKVGMPS